MKKAITLFMLLMTFGCSVITAVPNKEPFETGIRTVSVNGVEINPSIGVWVAYMGPYYQRVESQIGGLLSKSRISSAKITIILNADDDSIDRMRLVKLEIEPKDSSRHVKINMGSVDVDSDWSIPIDRNKRKDGLWEITPVNQLVRGEYAIWHPRGKKDPREGHFWFPGRERTLKFQQHMGGVLYTFGIDD